MKPQFQDETPINPFDFWQGADFKLKIVKQDGYWNYDRSEFGSAATLGDFEDDRLEEIYNSQYSLSDFTDQKNFKSYTDLEARLNMVLGKTRTARMQEEEEQEPVFNVEETVKASTPDFNSGFGSSVDSLKEDEDPDLSYFAKLAED